MFTCKTDATGAVRDVHVINKMRRKRGCCILLTISPFLSGLEVTHSTVNETLLHGLLRLADADLAVLTRYLVDGAVLVAFTPIYALAIFAETLIYIYTCNYNVHVSQEI